MVAGEGLRRVALAIGIATATLSAPVRAEGASCPAVWPPRAPVSRVSLLDPANLLTLRNITQPAAGLTSSSALAVSPDRRRVAFFVAQPVLSANDTCESLVVLEVTTPGDANVVDSGGGAILNEQVLDDLRYPSGFLETNIPVWSPDGRALAYRKRVLGRTQAWVVRLDGAPARQLSHADQDVEAVAWSRDGRRLLYSVRPGRAAFAAARAAEGRSGFLYDERIVPPLSAEPQLPADLPEQIMAIGIDGGDASPASEPDRAAFSPPITLTVDDLVPAKRADGLVAGAAHLDSTYLAQQRVYVAHPDGSRVDCDKPVCKGALRAVWWHGDEVMFLKRDGWYREDSVIAAWSPATGRVRTVLRTGDKMSDCTDTHAGTLCLAEDARRPRRIVAIDPLSGTRREFFDPNPEVDAAALPVVERLRWRNNLGLEAWADLVLPPGRPPAGGWPLVIVQYRSDGFLRGGTGDEYPIFPFAGRGIAVFSFQRPDFPPHGYSNAEDPRGMVAALHRNWSDRRSVHDSLMKGLDLALTKGPIDPTRIGITGLSDGSTTTRFALINQDRFAAAAISTCCIEPFNIMALGGPAMAAWFRSVGFPDASRPDPDFWRPASMALNAARMDTPLLMQLADSEFINSLETFTALREHGKPVELYVFPNEYHLKRQPVHRAAIYDRNLDWFSFWLQDRVDPDPAKAAQYRRWNAMKAGLATNSPAP
jgi:dipeptidyl aminopeptidase/acylaminoacyl peptidase